MDDWKATWDWAQQVWGDNADYSFHTFFRGVASRVAEYEGWEELGSSDVWHASFSCVDRLRQQGGVETRDALVSQVLDYHGLSRHEVCF